jgi:hypothetical protein
VIVNPRGRKTRKAPPHNDHSQERQACEIGREDAACNRGDVVVGKIPAEGSRMREMHDKKAKSLTHSKLRLVRPEKAPLAMEVILLKDKILHSESK